MEDQLYYGIFNIKITLRDTQEYDITMYMYIHY